MSKVCIDDDLKNVVGGLHTPFDDDNDDNKINESKPIQENDKMTADEKN